MCVGKGCQGQGTWTWTAVLFVEVATTRRRFEAARDTRDAGHNIAAPQAAPLRLTPPKDDRGCREPSPQPVMRPIRGLLGKSQMSKVADHQFLFASSPHQ